MGRAKKFAALTLTVILAISVLFVFAGCEPEDEKYCVTVMIARQETVKSAYANVQGPVLEYWIITPDTDNLKIEQEYDGKYYAYYVCAYNVADHPELSDVWFKYFGYRSYSVFSFKYEKQPERSDKINAVCEKGFYQIRIKASDESSLFYPREIYLNITVV